MWVVEVVTVAGVNRPFRKARGSPERRLPHPQVARETMPRSPRPYRACWQLCPWRSVGRPPPPGAALGQDNGISGDSHQLDRCVGPPRYEDKAGFEREERLAGRRARGFGEDDQQVSGRDLGGGSAHEFMSAVAAEVARAAGGGAQQGIMADGGLEDAQRFWNSRQQAGYVD